MKTKTIIMLIFLLNSSALLAQEKVIIGGSGGLIEEMEKLANAYTAKHPADKVEIRKETMGTTMGIGAVLIGRLTIGLVTSRPKGEEQAKLVYRIVGRSPVGVAVHKSLAVTGLTEAQICDIFSGRTKSWKEVGAEEGKITVLTRKQNDANTEAVRERVACFKDLKFSAEAIALMKGSEILDSLNRRPGTIGIISATFNTSERTEIKMLAINGVLPTPEAVRGGKYRVYNERGLVTLGAPQGATKRFLDFMATAEGQKILVNGGVIPAL
jgi:phosphate transport system substrate-binding protein